MNISLTPDVEKFVNEKVARGEYATIEQAVNDLLLQRREEEQLTPEDIAELRADLAVGIAEADRGECVELSLDQILRECHEEHRKVS
jgi:antitoxin ParD1/3/4